MHPLLSTDRLAALVDSADPPVLLDARWRLQGTPGAKSYAEAHLPGAVFADVDADLAGEPGAGGRHPLPDPAALQAFLRGAGVRTGQPVVAYDDGDGSIAARVWWLLRWSGHPEVAVLDGGYAAWTEEGRPVTADVPSPALGDIVVSPGGMPLVDADGAAELARTGSLLDARARPRYAGETEPVDPKAGHIPGAVNAPFADHIGPDGRWRSPAELATRFAGLGVAADQPVGAYCGSGVTAASVLLALEVSGTAENPALYAGSWSHWARDDARPVATGDQPG